MQTTTTASPRALGDLLGTLQPGQLINVKKAYPSAVALDGVSLTIHSGELVALLGANGAGKTTAVKMLLGLAQPSSGTVRVFGADPREAANRVRTGAMLQVGKVPETLRVREHIDLFRGYYPDPLPLDEVIDAAGLRGVENRIFGELSGGQKQRVLFALSICGNPDLLILDEPTVGLDVEARRGMWEQIRRFVRGGRSILLTTHYLEEADALADRVVVIDRGKIIAEGTSAEIKAKAAGKRVRCTTSLPLDSLLALAGVTSATREGNTTEILASDSDMLVRALFLADPSLTNLEVASAGLEEAFLTLTNHKKEVA
jgi:ABC-2 type transport system ATP-binding protein